MQNTFSQGSRLLKSRVRIISIVYLSTLVAATVLVNPWTNMDPINQPKLIALLVGVSFFFPALIVNLFKKNYLSDFFVLSIFAFLLLYISSAFFRERSTLNYLWGIHGRSTGTLAYLALMMVALFAFLSKQMLQLNTLLVWFIRTGYFVTSYAILQFASLDPIGWDSRGQIGFSTLGNINYSSSFMGMTTVAMLGRIMDARLSPSGKVWYLSVSAVNAIIIYGSGSMQGFVTIATGIALLIFLKTVDSRKVNFKFMIFLFFFIVGWLTSFVGLYGKGPLSTFLRQDTMIFRLDYWNAGVGMIISSPFRGLGPDEFGSFYREFRSSEATYRTDPTRFSDSAHNVFIDVGASIGLIGLIIFLGIFLLTFVRSISRLKLLEDYKHYIVDFKVAFVVFVVFFLQLIYSINQIGVTVWGMAFMGILARKKTDFENGSITTMRNLNAKKILNRDVRQARRQTSIFYFAALLSFLFVVFIIFPRANNDFQFKSAFSRGDFDLMMSMSLSPFTPDAWGNIVLDRAIAEGRRSESLSLAEKLVSKNDRNYYAWSVIWRHEDSPIEKRSAALERMKRLDPKNLEIQRESVK